MLRENNKEIREKLFNEIKDLPIIDYHCHLSPKEIYLDEPFSDIGDLWLSYDHYKWRLMRSAGVDEKYITGKETTTKEKYTEFARVLARAFGNPVKEWVKMELKTYFSIDTPLNEKTADDIWEKTSQIIKENELSPRKLIKQSGVEYIATTDDVLDDLEYHEKLKDYEVKVAPTFRTDKLLEFKDVTYISLLANKTKIKMRGIESFEKAVKMRMDYFIAHDCKFSDIGIEDFPTKIASREEADLLIKDFLDKDALSKEDRERLQGYIFVFLGKLYAEKGIIMQLHLSSLRNPNMEMFNKLGRDTGFDSVGECVPARALSSVLNRIGEKKLPRTIVYTLNPTMYYQILTLAGSFPEVIPGMAWWFNDHERGIFEFLEKTSELGYINGLIGMLTDSRSFLSYVRHTYFREILCDFLSQFYDGNNYSELLEVAKNLAYLNAKKLLKKRERMSVKKYMGIRSQKVNGL